MPKKKQVPPNLHVVLLNVDSAASVVAAVALGAIFPQANWGFMLTDEASLLQNLGVLSQSSKQKLLIYSAYFLNEFVEAPNLIPRLEEIRLTLQELIDRDSLSAGRGVRTYLEMHNVQREDALRLARIADQIARGDKSSLTARVVESVLAKARRSGQAQPTLLLECISWLSGEEPSEALKRIISSSEPETIPRTQWVAPVDLNYFC